MKSVISEPNSGAMSFLIWVLDLLCFFKFRKYLVAFYSCTYEFTLLLSVALSVKSFINPLVDSWHYHTESELLDLSFLKFSLKHFNFFLKI